MPTGLHRYQQTQNFHFITFSCYGRQPVPQADAAKDAAQQILEEVRTLRRLHIAAYVFMPEHVHLLTDSRFLHLATVFGLMP